MAKQVQARRMGPDNRITIYRGDDADVWVEPGPALKSATATKDLLGDDKTAPHYHLPRKGADGEVVHARDARGNLIVEGKPFQYLDWLGDHGTYVYTKEVGDVKDGDFLGTVVDENDEPIPVEYADANGNIVPLEEVFETVQASFGQTVVMRPGLRQINPIDNPRASHRIRWKEVHFDMDHDLAHDVASRIAAGEKPDAARKAAHQARSAK